MFNVKIKYSTCTVLYINFKNLHPPLRGRFPHSMMFHTVSRGLSGEELGFNFIRINYCKYCTVRQQKIEESASSFKHILPC